MGKRGGWIPAGGLEGLRGKGACMSRILPRRRIPGAFCDGLVFLVSSPFCGFF